MLRVKIHKMTAEGEQVDVDIDVPRSDVGDLQEYLGPAFALVDKRLGEMNQRLLMAFKTLEHFPAEYRGAIKVLLDAIHHGRYDQLGTIPNLIQQSVAHLCLPCSGVEEEGPNG